MKKWRSQIEIDTTIQVLGYFSNEGVAADVYNLKVIEHNSRMRPWMPKLRHSRINRRRAEAAAAAEKGVGRTTKAAPRPKSAYMCFQKKAFADAKRERPGLARTELVREVASRWKVLGTLERTAFEAESAALRRQWYDDKSAAAAARAVQRIRTANIEDVTPFDALSLLRQAQCDLVPSTNYKESESNRRKMKRRMQKWEAAGPVALQKEHWQRRVDNAHTVEDKLRAHDAAHMTPREALDLLHTLQQMVPVHV